MLFQVTTRDAGGHRLAQGGATVRGEFNDGKEGSTAGSVNDEHPNPNRASVRDNSDGTYTLHAELPAEPGTHSLQASAALI